MVMRGPREELENLVQGIQAQIESIRNGLERMLPPVPRGYVGQITPREINLNVYSIAARNKLEELKRGVDQLRIRALRGLPRL